MTDADIAWREVKSHFTRNARREWAYQNEARHFSTALMRGAAIMIVNIPNGIFAEIFAYHEC